MKRNLWATLKDKRTVKRAKKRGAKDRRRRKMVHDLSIMENQRREELIIQRMKRQSQQEEELSYEVWRTQQCKSIVIENRQLREKRYERWKELDAQNALAREEEMIRTLDE